MSIIYILKQSSSPKAFLIFIEKYILHLQQVYRINHNTHCHFYSAKVTLLNELVTFCCLLQTQVDIIYIHSNEIHNVVALIKCLLVLRCQLYMFRTVTVHPQELLCRYCMCRLWYVLIRPAGRTLCISLECTYIVKNDTRTFQCQETYQCWSLQYYFTAMRFRTKINCKEFILLRNCQFLYLSRKFLYLQSPTVRYYFRERRPLNRILNHMNPIHILSSYSFETFYYCHPQKIRHYEVAFSPAFRAQFVCSGCRTILA